MDGFDIPRPRRGAPADRCVGDGLPVRGRCCRKGVRTAYFDGTPEQVRRIRNWGREALRLPEEHTLSPVLVLSELVTNAVLHTASGGRFGRVRVELEVLPGDVVILAVTDDGPRPVREHRTGA